MLPAVGGSTISRTINGKSNIIR